jgi:hypothetical protein
MSSYAALSGSAGGFKTLSVKISAIRRASKVHICRAPTMTSRPAADSRNCLYGTSSKTNIIRLYP